MSGSDDKENSNSTRGSSQSKSQLKKSHPTTSATITGSVLVDEPEEEPIVSPHILKERLLQYEEKLKAEQAKPIVTTTSKKSSPGVSSTYFYNFYHMHRLTVTYPLSCLPHPERKRSCRRLLMVLEPV